MISKRRAYVLCFTAALAAAIATTGAFLYFGFVSGPIGKIYSIINLLDQNFYRPIDRAAALEGASRGVVNTLGDPYSVYMSKREWEEFQVRTSGEYSGIGVTIGVSGDYVEIAKPMKGSPAEEAGLQAGDVILKVDGKAISTSDEAASLIRGPAGTDVTITLGRGTESFDVTITRREISVPATSYEMLENDIGYIELMSFNEHSDTEVAAALQSLKSDGAKAIVLDLRYNGGGYVNQCLNIAEMLIPEGPVVTLDYKNQPQETYSSRGSGLGLPLFVLVNGGSASASEILAGAIQDRGVGKLIGETTFGKGLVQGAYPLRDGSVVKLTTAEYLTPSGRAINGDGLKPDYEVAGDEEQLQKALELAAQAVAGTQ
ncbi:MAG: S41 family peptidase [Bacillota bacterium]